jgi:hypothetical protein
VTPIGTSQIAAWNGPYLGATIGTASADSLATGYTAYIRNMSQRYDLDNNVGEATGGTAGATFSATKTLFAAIRINGLTKAQAAILNKSIDGGDDADQADGSNTTGRFRWDKPAVNAATVTAYYLAIPIVL